MKLKTITYELRDVAIVQAPVSYCEHRGDVNNKVTICKRGVYPVFVSPMASITDEKNYKVWIENGLTPVVPRSVQQNITFNERMQIAKETFVSISLSEAKNEFMKYLEDCNYVFDSTLYICIDIAHGTLNSLYNICRLIKDKCGSNVVIMTGNVANPNTYQFYADAGVDYCRVSIGSGSRCTSSANVGVHYGLATLIDQLNEQRKAYAHAHNGYAPTKLIVDGGISNFDDINKSIALGADAVMCGNLIARSEEACGDIYELNGERVRDYYGMSTKRAQRITGGKGDRTSEGIDKPIKVEYPIAKWVDNMQSYLRSAMTYTNSRSIKEMQENAQVIILGGSGDLAYRK